MKGHKIIHAVILTVLLAVILTGCANPAPVELVLTEAPKDTAAQNIIVTDALNREIAFEKLPERVVVAGKATALLVNTLYLFPEAATRIVAIENRSQSPDAFIPMVDPTYVDKLVLEKNAGAEAIAPTQPDVVVLKATMKKSLGDPLETIGIKVIYLDLETPDAFYRDLQTIGVLFGNSQRADEITGFYQVRVNLITEVLGKLQAGDKPGVLLVQHSLKDNVTSFEVPPANWLQSILLETAGATPVWKADNSGDGWQMATLDQIAVWNPWGIAVIDYSGGAMDAITAMQADPTWQQIDALQENHLAAFPMDFLSWDQPDPRWILGLQWLAYITHPDLFPDYDLRSEVMDFYESLYGLDQSTISEKIFPLLKGTLEVEREVNVTAP
jgi:iron complex transport system substrate-binding protein